MGTTDIQAMCYNHQFLTATYSNEGKYEEWSRSTVTDGACFQGYRAIKLMDDVRVAFSFKKKLMCNSFTS